jgi:hypothetical protein
MSRKSKIQAVIDRYYDRLLDAAQHHRVEEIEQLHRALRLFRLALYELQECEALLYACIETHVGSAGSLLSFRPADPLFIDNHDTGGEP